MNGFISSSDFASAQSDTSLDTVTRGFTDENVCGEGASCIVYGMRHGDLMVAVKRLRRELIEKSEYRSSYRKEFRIGQRLKHSSLPVYRDLRDDQDEVYIEMDYVDGVTIEDFIRTREGREYFSSPEYVRRFLRELLDVVTYLHRSGVIHSDLKLSNIMLRNSDRGVILIDFDKAYSDTLNNNHGGTMSFSDPLEKGLTPTSFKDISAIGVIIDRIAEALPEFPVSKFKRFRKECKNEKFNENKLSDLLRPKSNWTIPIISGMFLIALVFTILIWEITIQDRQTDSSSMHSDVYHENSDDRMIEDTGPSISVQSETEQPNSAHQDSSESIAAPNTPSFISIPDMDEQMEEFTSKVETAYEALTSGIPRDRVREYTFELAQSYTSSYHTAVTGAKLRNPDIPAIDVELAVARAYERSRAGKLYSRFNEAVSDSIRKWDNGLDDNFY